MCEHESELLLMMSREEVAYMLMHIGYVRGWTYWQSRRVRPMTYALIASSTSGEWVSSISVILMISLPICEHRLHRGTRPQTRHEW